MIVVLGGGPAGLAAATALARAGREVMVHEAGVFPRHRVCGEFLSPDAEQALAALGLPRLAERLGAPEIAAVRATSARGGRVVADASWPLEAPGRGLSRFDLDERLARTAREAGAVVKERSRLRDVPAGADAAILATGRVTDEPGRDGRDTTWVGIKVHLRGLRLPGVSELHAVAGAYAGLNEVVCRGEVVVNACALLREDAWRRAGGSPEEAWERLAAESPAFAQRWRAAVRVEGTEVASSGFSFRARRPVRGGALVVGDAAGVVAPLSGAGQAAALASGLAAAQCLLDADPAASWTREFRARFGRRLRVGRALQGALLAPTAAAWMIRGIATAPRAARWVYRATRGPLAVSGPAGAAAPR